MNAKVCAFCGAPPPTWSRADKTYCNNACRMRCARSVRPLAVAAASPNDKAPQTRAMLALLTEAGTEGVSALDALPCKVWAGSKAGRGYGKVRHDGRDQYVHRLAWEQAHGPIPVGMDVCHHCDNPPCYETTHLFIGTRADNLRDCRAKGRLPLAKLTPDQAEEIRASAVSVAGGMMRAYARLGAQYGVGPETVRRIRIGMRWGSPESTVLETA